MAVYKWEPKHAIHDGENDSPGDGRLRVAAYCRVSTDDQESSFIVQQQHFEDLLEKHKDEPIFMRTDHHWSSLGAFYACEAFSAEARVPFARIEEYDRKSKDDYVGTLYTFSNNIILKENPEEFFWYIPRAHFTTTFYNNSFGNPREGDYFMNIDNVAPVSYYMVYMAGDDHIVRVQTDVHNGRRLCIIKDSYGNALAPWLTSSFEEIYIIDMRYFQLNAISFLREHGMTDVLFAMNTFSANGDNGAKVEKIRTQ